MYLYKDELKIVEGPLKYLKMTNISSNFNEPGSVPLKSIHALVCQINEGS